MEEDVSRAADLGAGFDAGGRMPNPVSSSSKKGLDMATSGGRVAARGVGNEVGKIHSVLFDNRNCWQAGSRSAV